MTLLYENTLDIKIQPNDHPYLNGAWKPCAREVDAVDMEVIGEIPKDISGIYVRNTENPVREAIGVYHPFDGDGMLHTMSFHEGKAKYANRMVQTKGLLAEAEAGEPLWTGIATSPNKSQREGWGARGRMKDSSSTDVVMHAGHILSTFYMCGEGYILDPENLETKGTADWVPSEGISAHPKADLATGELLFFNYGKEAPFMHYGVVGADNKLKHFIPVETPGPRLPHDMAFTENYSIIADLPLFWDPELLKAGIHSNVYDPNLPTRFAIFPRYGSVNEIRWFEAAPTYVLHWMNAWEEGDEIILEGYFQENPDPEPLNVPGFDKRFGKILANLDEHSFRPKYHRWRFNMVTGKTIEERVDDRILEFGTFNQNYAGKKTRYAYSTTTEPGWFLFNGLVKHDMLTGDTESYTLEPGRYASETPFVPRINAKAEDDGYLVSFIIDNNNDTSECILIDAQHVSEGPVCRIILPHKISSGTHATWANRSEYVPH